MATQAHRSYFVVTVEEQQWIYQAGVLFIQLHLTQYFAYFCVAEMIIITSTILKIHCVSVIAAPTAHPQPCPTHTHAHTHMCTHINRKRIVTTYFKVWSFPLLSSQLCQGRVWPSDQGTVLWTVITNPVCGTCIQISLLPESTTAHNTSFYTVQLFP